MSIRLWAEGEGGKRPSVRRCLFGKTDHENLARALSVQEQHQAQIDADAERFRDRWGMDPTTGCPVDGATYICTPVDLRKESIPEFYTKGYAPRRKSKPVNFTSRENWRGSYNQFLFGDTTQVHSRRSVNAKRRLELDNDQENHVSKRPLICIKRQQLNLNNSDLSLHQQRQPVTVSSSTVPCCSSNDKHETPQFQRQYSAMDRFMMKKRCRVNPPPFLDLATPKSIEAHQHTPRQTEIKDFFPLKKTRSSSSKSLFEV